MNVPAATVPDGVALEGLLQQACENAAWRPALYRQLVQTRVLVIVPDEEQTRGVARPDRLHFVQWMRQDGTSAIPVFSSARTFFEAVPSGAKCLVIEVQQLLELTRGAILHLNPYSEFNLQLMPSDVELLLTQKALVVPDRFTRESQRELSFRRVADPPVAMLDALTTLYSQHACVTAAYLAAVTGLYDDSHASLLLGLDIDGDPEPIVRDSGLVIRDTYHGPVNLDIVRIPAGAEGLSRSGFSLDFRFFDRRMAAVLVAPAGGRSPQ